MSLLQSLSKKITAYDGYAFRYSFQFNRSGSSVNKTFRGGIFSLLIDAFLLFFISYKVFQMIDRDLDTIQEYTKETDWDEIGLLDMEKANILPFLSFSDIRTLSPIVIDFEELS